MSEYQYYEFRAIDQPLTERDMAALRAVTSRAEITPSSLINVYHWGDFKGNPDRLMDKYFDAHLYLANWGTRRLMFRLPAESLPASMARPYAVANALTARTSGADTVLDFHSDCDGGGDDFVEGEGWLASLIPLRSELTAGDTRCLYLGWLAALETGEVGEDEVEPPVPPGLGKLSASLKRFAVFLRVDPDLIEVAAAASGEFSTSGPSAKELAGWVASLSTAEKDKYLVRLMQGEGGPAAGELLRLWRASRVRAEGKGAAAPPRRPAGELLAARDRVAGARERKAAGRAAREHERRVRDAAAARERHLDSLAGRENALWRQVEEAIGTRKPAEYDRAVELLKDLRDLADRTATGGEVARRVGDLRQRHRTKPSLIARLARAGFAS